MRHKRRVPESKYRPTRHRKLTPAETARMLPRGIQLLAFRDAKARGKTVPDVWIAEEIVPLSPLTPSQRKPIEAMVKLRAEDWHTIHRARLAYLWSARQDNLGVITADMEKAKNEVELAYQRGDLIDKRRRLMDAWADYCAKPAGGGAVTPIRGVR
jgi:hypothetical protein